MGAYKWEETQSHQAPSVWKDGSVWGWGGGLPGRSSQVREVGVGSPPQPQHPLPGAAVGDAAHPKHCRRCTGGGDTHTRACAPCSRGLGLGDGVKVVFILPSFHFLC